MAHQRKYRSTTREYHNLNQIVHRRRRQAVIHEIKMARGCADCGYRGHPVALDFDHRPGVDKLFTIGQDARRKWSEIEAEIEKCDVVCSNCHRIRTYRRNNPDEL